MTKYMATINLSRIVEAKDLIHANKIFANIIEQELKESKTELFELLINNTEVLEIGESLVYAKQKYCCPVCHSEYDEILEARQCEIDCREQNNSLEK